MAKICYIECEEHGHIALSFDSDRATEKASQHSATCDGQLYLHVFESVESRKL